MNAPGPGWYKLTKDVTNPKPDRRSKQKNCIPVWGEGLHFKIEYNQEHVDRLVAAGLEVHAGTIHFMDRTQIHFDIGEKDRDGVFTQGNGLLQASVPATDNLEILLCDISSSPADLIRAAVKTGKLTLNDVRELEKWIETLDENEYFGLSQIDG